MEDWLFIVSRYTGLHGAVQSWSVSAPHPETRILNNWSFRMTDGNADKKIVLRFTTDVCYNTCTRICHERRNGGVGVLYKYHKNNKHLISLLLNARLYMNSPTRQNDPFDTEFSFSVVKSKDEFLEYFEKRVIPRIPDKKTPLEMFDEQLSAGEIERVGENKYRYTDDMKDHMDKDSLDQLRITCFSDRKDSIAMWSHYAESHTGVCLGFEYFKVDEFRILCLLDTGLDIVEQSWLLFTLPDGSVLVRAPLLEVDYSRKDIPVIDFTKNDFVEDIKIAVTSKSSDWGYEKERRLVLSKSAFVDKDPAMQFVYFCRESLREIIFGVNMCDEDKRDIVKIVKQSGYPYCSFSQAVKSKTSYDIDIVPYQA